MQTLCISPNTHPPSLHNKQILSLQAPQPSPYHYRTRLCNLTSRQQHLHLTSSSFLGFNPLRIAGGAGGLMKRKRPEFGVVCFSGPLSVKELQWVSSVCTVVLMLTRGTAIHKSFLVPLFALQAPASIITWMKGEYGIWSAFLALLVRLFFFIPGELELPFMALLLVIVAPYQVLNLRGKQEGVILSLAIAAYLAFQHFSRAGNLRKAFDQGSVIATLAIICCAAIPCLLLI